MGGAQRVEHVVGRRLFVGSEPGHDDRVGRAQRLEPAPGDDGEPARRGDLARLAAAQREPVGRDLRVAEDLGRRREVHRLDCLEGKDGDPVRLAGSL